jgi:putative heme-binding domain-containing protein
LKSEWLPEVNKENPAFTDNAERLLFALDAVAADDVVPALIHAMAKGRFNDDQTVKAVTLVATHGDAAQAGTVVEQLCTRLEQGDEVALWAWEALYKGTSGRGVIPTSGLERAVKLIDRQPGYTQTHAIEAAGAWRIAAARPALNALLAKSDASTEVHERAIRALQGIGGDESKATILELSKNHPNRATRLEAIRALAGIAPEESALAALALMQAGTSEGEVKALLDTYLKNEPALNALSKQLEGQTLPVETAKQAARTLSSSGRNVETLMTAVRTAGGLDALAEAWTPEAIAALVAKVKTEGDPARGEQQFRALACSQCHAIGGAGGLLGPDLSSIGGSAQVDYLVESILQPAKAVKEGYHSIIVETSDLETFSGVKVQENDTTMVLRDVNGEHTIYKDKIDNIEEGTSLMPVGLADTILENELADLVNFLSSLGRVPEWSLGTDKIVRGWEVLQNTPEGLERLFQDGPEVVGAGHDELTWGPAYSTVGGELPLAELPLLNHRYWHNKGYSAARFSLTAAQAGAVNLALGVTEGLDIWVNGELIPKDQLGAVELPQGDSTVTILVRHDTATAPLRAQVQEAGETAVTLKLAGK